MSFVCSLIGIKKFECSMTPPPKTSTSIDPKITDIDLSLHQQSLGGGSGLNKTDESGGNSKKPFLSPFMENELYFATCNPRKNKIMAKRHYNVSPDGVSSLDDYSSTNTTLLCETNLPGNGRRMSITISDGNSSEISSEPIVIAESLETSSLITQSTTTTSSPLPSPSSSCLPGSSSHGLSHLSMATTMSCKKNYLT